MQVLQTVPGRHSNPAGQGAWGPHSVHAGVESDEHDAVASAKIKPASQRLMRWVYHINRPSSR